MIPHDVVTGPTQLVRHRFERHHGVTLGFLSLVETANLGTKPDRKVGRFHKRPAQILIPVIGVAAAFAFAVGKFLAALANPLVFWH